jgi:hypothetical protein
MKFKDRRQFMNYAQFIPGTFLIIWILSFAYVLYFAPSYPNEIEGKIYAMSIKSKTIYISLIEEIFVYGSILAFFLSMLAINLVASHYWKDEKENE